MVRADSRSHGELQLRRLRDALRSEIGGPERLGDDDFRLGELSLEGRIGPVLVRGDHELVSASFDERSQAELARDAAEELPRLEVDLLRRGRGLAAVVALDTG